MDDPLDQDDPLAEPINECWSCGRLFGDGCGHSLDGTENEIVCHRCWVRIPPWRRIWLGLWFRTQARGGFGLAELISSSMSSIWMFGQRPSRN